MCNNCCKPCCPRCPPLCGSKCQPPCKYHPVSCLIFDLESAVFDTRNIYQRACREIVMECERELPDDVLLESSPMETPEMAELIVRRCKLPMSWDEFLLKVNDLAFNHISFPQYIPGVERLVNHLTKCCIPMALVTNCSQKLYEQKLRGREHFFKSFCHVVCTDDAQLNQRKPAPDIYLLCLSRFEDDVKPKCCLVLDGKQKGVQAARDARMQVVMLPEPNLPCCWSELATLRLTSLEDFKPEEFGLPEFDCEERRKGRGKT